MQDVLKNELERFVKNGEVNNVFDGEQTVVERCGKDCENTSLDKCKEEVTTSTPLGVIFTISPSVASQHGVDSGLYTSIDFGDKKPTSQLSVLP